MIILARRNFSNRLQDEDYINEQKNRKKEVKHAKRDGAIFFGIPGALMGGAIGSTTLKNSGRNGLIGAAVGGTAGTIAGRYIGKKVKKDTERDADAKISRYQNASRKEKDYLLQKERYDKEIALKKQQADAQTALAINSFRW